MTNWNVILEGESRFLDEVAKKIGEIGRDIDSLGKQDQALELVYSAMKSSLDIADADFSAFEAEVRGMQQQGISAPVYAPFLPPQIQNQIQQAPPEYQASLGQLIVCFRVCLRRPSDVFRQELRKQIGIIVGGLQQIIMSTPPQQLPTVTRDIENICTLVCSIEQPFEQQNRQNSQGWDWSKMLSWQGLATVLGSMIAGHFFVQPAMEWADNQLGLGWFSSEQAPDLGQLESEQAQSLMDSLDQEGEEDFQE